MWQLQLKSAVLGNQYGNQNGLKSTTQAGSRQADQSVPLFAFERSSQRIDPPLKCILISDEMAMYSEAKPHARSGLSACSRT